MEQTPSVGRIVHYVSRGSADGVFPPTCRAAVITEVDGPQPASAQVLVGLCVLNPTGLFFDQHLPFREPGFDTDRLKPTYVGGTWHWPERV
jgi:hypothetical protein